MKTKEDVYEKMLELHAIGVKITLKHSVYVPGQSFEFTELPTPEQGVFKKLEVMLYVNETYDDMWHRMDKFLNYREAFLSHYATEDFKSLLDSKGMLKYITDKQNE